MTIRVSGQASLNVRYVTELDMTEEEFKKLTPRKQDELLIQHVEWHRIARNAEISIGALINVEEINE